MGRPYLLSAPIRAGRELEFHEWVDKRFRDIALSFGAREAQYPSLIAADALERAEYPRAFPHLLLSAGRYQASAKREKLSTPVTPEWCLSPTVCHHVYAHLARSVLQEPIALTARGTCFRHEHHCMPGIRQVEFAMRELVFLGSRHWVLESADAVARSVESVARGIGLDGEWREAADPFFLPEASGKAALQWLTKAKHEYQLRDDSRLALASVNRHGTFFSERFQITMADDQPVHSACIAVGLDRWSHAAACVDARREASL
jgi:hypothetical protein